MQTTERQTSGSSTVFTVLLLALVIVVADQFTKYIALTNLTLGEHEEVLGWFLQLVLAKNSGAAFSLLSGATWVFTIISSLVVISLLVYTLRRKITETKWAIVTALILAGAVGNLIDRFFREPGIGVGHVIDFIYTPWIVPAVYNVADISVVVGMGLFLIFSIFQGRSKEASASLKQEAD